MNERIAVFGAGAVGGYLGARLARTGNDVLLIDPWPEHVAAINGGGLRISSMTPAESHRVGLEALHLGDIQSLSKRAPIDIAIIACKSYDNDQRSSIAQDKPKGRKTEIHQINGLISRLGLEAGCPAPAHAALVSVVRQAERGKIAARPETLYALSTP